MDSHQKVLFVDATSGFYRLARYPIGDFFGPIDLGLHLSGRYNSLNFGVGLLAGSIFPGSNRLFFTGFSQAWGGFYVSSIGGAGLVFDNLGINLVALVGKAMVPSILYLNRVHGEEIEVRLEPVDRAVRVGAGARRHLRLTRLYLCPLRLIVQQPIREFWPWDRPPRLPTSAPSVPYRSTTGSSPRSIPGRAGAAWGASCCSNTGLPP